MFSPGYAWNELRRRVGRTLVTAFGLAAGVGLVMGIIGVSDGLSDAQNKVLSPLGSVGTDIIVTRTIAPTTSTATTTTTTPSQGGFGSGGGGFGGGAGRTGGAAGGGFFGAGAGVRGVSSLNSSDASTLLAANSSILTDLAKLGKPGTKFTHDFFVPGTLITFPNQAVSVVQKIPNVTAVTGALSLQALHESGTVPNITDTVKTGGQTLKVTTKPPTLTAAQQAAERACIQSAFSSANKSTSTATTTPVAPTTGGSGTAAGGGTTRRGGGTGTGGGGFIFRQANNSAINKCLTPAQKAYQQNVLVPEQTITRTLNPPTTDTQTSTYTVGGVDPASPNTGLVTKSQVTSGTWFTSTPDDEVLVNTAYASTKKLKAGGTVTINAKTYKIVGLVNPTLTGNISDVYFDLATMQSLSTNSSRVNEVLVSVKSSSDVDSVTAQIKKELPGAQILTEKTLANQVSGSLSSAKKLANTLGTALAIVVLLAAILIAALLTLSSVSKRVREIGTLRAIGWTRGEVVRQIVAETLGIGILGGVLGIGIGLVISAIVGAVGPGLSVTATGLNVGASTISQTLGQSTVASNATIVHLTSPIHLATILIALAGAIVGGLLAGAAGGWRASRLAPAVALRDLG